ncbi:MAG: primosomal protein N' [Bacteroidota bacterium]
MVAELIIPVPVYSSFEYAVPEHLKNEVAIGKRVLVPFGPTKLKTGLISKLSESTNSIKELKELSEILDEYPIVSSEQLKFWNWIAYYYMCTLGEVMLAALPSSFILKSESKVRLIRDADFDGLSGREQRVIQTLLNRNELKVEQFSDILEIKNPKPFINRMIEKGLVYLSESAHEQYVPKFQSKVKRNKRISHEEIWTEAESVEQRAPKQFAALIRFAEMEQGVTEDEFSVNKKEFLDEARVSNAVLKALVQKEILEEIKVPIGRNDSNHSLGVRPSRLSDAQEKAFNEINSGFNENMPVLLHGVTGSGKTEIYIHLIDRILSQGHRCLYLVPEIALSTQLVERLKAHFGNVLGVFHSNVSSPEKYELWKDLVKQKFKDYKIIIGARSALFLPISNLGLIIVDESHDSSYKQQDPAPRYNARDLSLKLARIHKSQILLGTATPSLESLAMVNQNKMRGVNLSQRYGNASLPQIELIDLRKDLRKKGDRAIFSFRLQREIGDALKRKEQVILFQNRRGYVPFWQCESCGDVPGCDNCDVSLTYHKSDHKLQCHYCGSKYVPPSSCQSCGSNVLKMKGFGTEKVEDELSVLFPDANIQRMDYDTTRGKFAFQKIINRFAEGQIDILVGTQMVSKGLDFGNVSLVGVLDADAIVNWPDFRSMERAFQMMVQISGRAGRNERKGKVLIQTRKPNLELFNWVQNTDFNSFIDEELKERYEYNYPPFVRLIKFSLRHSDPILTNQAGRYFHSLVQEKFGSRALGPNPPLIQRIKRKYIQEVLLKLERNTSSDFVRQTIISIIDRFNEYKQYRSIRIVINVDPN